MENTCITCRIPLRLFEPLELLDLGMLYTTVPAVADLPLSPKLCPILDPLVSCLVGFQELSLACAFVLVIVI